MALSRKIIVYIATSADGYIARRDGSVDSLDRPRAFAKRLRARRGKHIWMMGGAELVASFLDKGQIDEFWIHNLEAFCRASGEVCVVWVPPGYLSLHGSHASFGIKHHAVEVPKLMSGGSVKLASKRSMPAT